LYAILDVESTGGQYNEEGITEVAIYRFDGHEIVDQFASLINPERKIQPFVQKLTGINNAMLVRAPKFYEVAKRIIEIMDGAVLVAHNADFDYRMLRLEFERLGYEFEVKTLCTVQLSQKLLPEQTSYSLGKLVKSLGIPITDRHRATGDALATVKLFKLLLNKDVDRSIIQDSLQTHDHLKINSKIKDLIDQTPSKPGIYYLHNDQKELLFIGKSRNMKKRLRQQFTSQQRKALKLTEATNSVTYENTGSELIAAIKEFEAIKKLKPKFNRKPRPQIYSHGLYRSIDPDGYERLQITSARKDRGYLATYSTAKAGRSFLDKLTDQHQLCRILNGLEKGGGPCEDYKNNDCLGACIQRESTTAYNQRVDTSLQSIGFTHSHQVIVDRGREVSERSVVLIQNNQVQGYAYVDLQLQFTDPAILNNILTTVVHTEDVTHLVHNYMRTKRIQRVIEVAPAGL
jgi:DNA polymerase-3 subunit epsilon